MDSPAPRLRTYLVVTGGYWAFTLTDGALRMLVLLHFNQLGYSPVSIAFLFLAYEFMGVVTNLLGGWVGARTGLNRTLLAGLTLQVVALAALTLQEPGWTEAISVAYVMAAQALSGVAKDLTKMSSKSAVKFLAGAGGNNLFRLVAALTGSKNALKGVGFFLGAALLARLGYDAALWAMAGMLMLAAVTAGLLLREDIGRATAKAPLRSILSKSPAINRLSAARLFLFGARDIWFVVALPVFLTSELDWSFESTGAFLAAWVIGYGIIQSAAPRLIGRSSPRGSAAGDRGRGADEVLAARRWALGLAVASAAITLAVGVDQAASATVGRLTVVAILGGLIVFGALFAVNSSIHSYLILAYADDDEVALDVGFYYSANAAGRLIGTLLSGVLYLAGGLAASLTGSTIFVLVSWLLALGLPEIEHSPETETSIADR